MSEEISPATGQRPVSEGEALVNASRSYFVAQRDAAAAELMIYLNRTAGVADHPNVVGNVNELVKKLAEANECLKVIQQTFSSNPATTSQ